MSRKQAEIVSINALNHIIKHGAQMAKDNLTIKNHLFNYSNKQGLSITNHLVVQSGEEQQRINEKTNQQLVPSKARKDNRFSNSVNTSPFKPDLNFKSGKLGISSRQTATHRSPRYANKSQYLVSKKISLRSRDDRSQIRFIDLTDIMQPVTDGKKITHEMKTQRNYIQKMRERIVSLDQNNRLKKQQEEQKTLKDKQRIQQLKNKFKKHMSKNNNNNISFDVDGNYIFVEAQDQQKALKRKYPPPNINFSFDQPLQLKIEQKKQPHIKQRAARGQVFASSVLKTMNMSKISLNLTTKTCNIDQFTFMRRNDLFNNNHSRQVTTIPYLQVSQGTNYTQTHTNTSVSKRTHRTAHSENKSKFKTHNLLQNLKENFQNNTNKTQFIEDELKIDQKRIQSSRPYTRPKTSMPKTAKTADRVTQVNKNLVCELIE